MKRNLSDYIVALVVLICSAVLLAALTMALSGYQVRKPSRTVLIDFPDVAGIHLYSEVRYAGAPAGRVIAMRPLDRGERQKSADKNNMAVRVTAMLNDDVPALAQDATASLGSDTLLSEKFVELSAGSPAVGLLANGAILNGQPGFSVDAIGREVTPMLDETAALLKTVKTNFGEILPKISALTDSTQETAKAAGMLMERGKQLLASNEGDLHASLVKLQDTLKSANDVMERTKGLVSGVDKDLASRMNELKVVLQNMKVVSTDAKAFSRTIGERPSKLIFGGKVNRLPSEEQIIRSEKPVPGIVPDGGR